MLKSDDIPDLVGYSTLTQEKREEYDELAWQLICARLIVADSLSVKTRVFLKEQCVVNQNNYPDTVVNAVAMIMSFGNGAVNGTNNGKDGGRGNKHRNSRITDNKNTPKQYNINQGCKICSSGHRKLLHQLET